MSALGASYPRDPRNARDPRDRRDPRAHGTLADRAQLGGAPQAAPGATAAPSTPAAPDAPAKRRGRGRILLVAVAGLLAAGGAALVLAPRLSRAPYSPGRPVPEGQIVTLGTMTVNASDGHLVQAGIDLQMTAAANLKAEATARPVLLNAAIQDFGHWSYGQLITPRGRAGLQHQLLASFRHILGTVDGGVEQVRTVYFTSFVAQ